MMKRSDVGPEEKLAEILGQDGADRLLKKLGQGDVDFNDEEWKAMIDVMRDFVMSVVPEEKLAEILGQDGADRLLKKLGQEDVDFNDEEMKAMIGVMGDALKSD